MLKELKTQHRNIIQMVFSGFSNNEIAERLGMNPASVSQIIRSPLGQAYLGGLNDKAQEDILDVRKKLTTLNKSALATFERILDPRQKAPPAVQATVAKDILDRNGYKPPDKINIDLTMAMKSDAEIDAEINALENAITKASQQDPIKEISEKSETLIPLILESTKEDSDNDPIDETEEFTIEEDYFNVDDLDLASSDETNEIAEIEDFSLDDDLLNKIPASIFNSSEKAS